MHKKIIVGVTGASGSIYARQLLKFLSGTDTEIYLIVSPAGKQVIKHELGVEILEPGEAKSKTSLDEFLGYDSAVTKIRHVGYNNFFSKPASGSFISDGMVICPCSMGTIARIRHGISSNLLERSADVTLKEGRKLVVLPREAPFSSIHLENMLALSRMGVDIVPASPAFYQHPQTIEDMVDFVVGKLADCLAIEHSLFPRWQENS